MPFACQTQVQVVALPLLVVRYRRLTVLSLLFRSRFACLLCSAFSGASVRLAALAALGGLFLALDCQSSFHFSLQGSTRPTAHPSGVQVAAGVVSLPLVSVAVAEHEPSRLRRCSAQIDSRSPGRCRHRTNICLRNTRSPDPSAYRKIEFQLLHSQQPAPELPLSLISFYSSF